MRRQRPHRSADPLLSGPLRKHWRTYLVPALGGAAVTSVYSIVDTIAIGYGVGPAGAAAAAVLVPSFGLMAFLGTLLGMGGAILLATARGRGDRREGDAWFTLSFLLCVIVGAIVAASVLLAGTPSGDSAARTTRLFGWPMNTASGSSSHGRARCSRWRWPA